MDESADSNLLIGASLILTNDYTSPTFLKEKNKTKQYFVPSLQNQTDDLIRNS